MTASALAATAQLRIACGPPRTFVVAIAAAGLIAPIYSVTLALRVSHVSEVQLGLLEWISVPYILVGVVAYAFLVELTFLDGRARLGGVPAVSLIQY